MTGAAYIQRTLAGTNAQPWAWQMARPQYVVITVIHSLNTFFTEQLIYKCQATGDTERERKQILCPQSTYILVKGKER